MAIVSRGASLPRQAAQVAGTTFLGQMAGRTLLPEPGTPEARGEFGPALREAARTGLEAGGAMLGGEAIPAAPRTAGLARRALTTGARAVSAGVGAGAGSLLAEAVDPSGQPLERALDTAKTTAAFDAGFQGAAKAVGKVLGPARRLTRTGEGVAQTLMRERLPLTGGVTHAAPVHAAEELAQEAVLFGSGLRAQRAGMDDTLSARIREVLQEAKAPRDPHVRQTMEAVGWDPTLAGDARRVNQRQTTQRLYGAVDDLNRTAFQASGRPLPLRGVAVPATEVLQALPPGAPQAALLAGLVRARTLPQRGAQVALQSLQQWQRSGQVPQAAAEALTTLMQAMQHNISDPVYINLAPLRQRLHQWRLENQGTLSPSLDRLLTAATQTPAHLSYGEAQTLRSELMEIARQYEPGGAQRLGTAMGQRPQPGTGRLLASRLQRQAQELARAVNAAMLTDMRRLDPALARAWQRANAAYQVGIHAATLERLFSKPSILDPVSGGYRGKGILAELGKRENLGELRTMRRHYGPEFVSNLREYAQALATLQEGAGPRRRIGHFALHAGLRTTGAILTGTGHPGIGLPMLLAPEALALVFQSRWLTKRLIYGLRAPAGSQAGWRALGQVMGVLAAHGIVEPPAPAPAGGR
jgi:hypothetical protein